MKRSIFQWFSMLILITMTVSLASCKGDDNDDNLDASLAAMKQWTPGTVVTEAAVTAYGGIDNCFISEQIPDKVWSRMEGNSYRENNYIQRSDLRYIRALHWNRNNEICLGEMVCNERIALTLANVLKGLFKAKYPIERMLLPDNYGADSEQQKQVNNSWCFSYRSASDSQTPSKHDLGLGVDLNPGEPTKISHGDVVYQLFTDAGFDWGGDKATEKDNAFFGYRDYTINVRFASIAEGQALVSADASYWDNMSTTNLDWRLFSNNASASSLKTLALSQIMEFTSDERNLINNAVFVISQRLKQIGSALPFPAEFVFVKSNNSAELYIDAYTRKNVVYISQSMLTKGLKENSNAQAFNSYLASQLFHCIGRNSMEFRRVMLGLIGFSVADKEFDIAPSVRKDLLQNPNSDRYDVYATFDIYGSGSSKQQGTYIFATRLNKTYGEVAKAAEKDATVAINPYNYTERILISTEDLSTVVSISVADDFWTKVGRNVRQFEDAEECIAINFGNAVIYGETGKKYDSPELITKIIKALSENW